MISRTNIIKLLLASSCAFLLISCNQEERPPENAPGGGAAQPPTQSSRASSRQLIDATKPQRILEIAKQYGDAELEKDEEGDPKISGRISGSRYMIVFYGCEDNVDCTNIDFRSYWRRPGEFTVDQMNAWNRANPTRAYLDEDDEPNLELSVNLYKSVSVDNLRAAFSHWESAVQTFKQKLLDN